MVIARLYVLAAIIVACGGALAQQPAPAETEPPLPPAGPIIEPGRELQGRALVEALRKGGFVLYVRHAEGTSANEPCTASVLTPAGEQKARKLGSALAGLKIPLGAVLASQTCRAQDTARLLGNGEFEVTQDLNPAGMPRGVDLFPARSKRLAELPRAGTNTLLVSHVHGGALRANWIHIEICELVVYRPDGKGGSEPVARIPLEAWEGLSRLATVN